MSKTARYPISDKMANIEISQFELSNCDEVMITDTTQSKFFSLATINGERSRITLNYNKPKVIQDFCTQNDYVLSQISTIYPYLNLSDDLTKETKNGLIDVNIDSGKPVFAKTILRASENNPNTDEASVIPYKFEVVYWMCVLLYGNNNVIYAPLPFKILRSKNAFDKPEEYKTIFPNSDRTYTIDCNTLNLLGMTSFLNFYKEKSPISILD